MRTSSLTNADRRSRAVGGARIRAALAAPPQPSQPSQPSQPRYSAAALYNLANSLRSSRETWFWRCSAMSAPHCWNRVTRTSMPTWHTFAALAHVSMKPRNRFIQLAQATNPTFAAWLGVLESPCRDRTGDEKGCIATPVDT